MVEIDYFVALFFMKTSQLYNLFNDRLSRCKSPDELVAISQDINSSSLNKREKAALALACIFAAKYFDKHGGKIYAKTSALECGDQV